jgi:hypothetical protein
MPVIPALGMRKQKDGKFEGSLGYIKKSCLKKPESWGCSSENFGMLVTFTVTNCFMKHLTWQQIQ